MNSTCQRIILILFLLIFFIPRLTVAETKTFVKEYYYQASDEDSKNSSRTVALREVKRLLLEELETYLESETEVQNFKLTKDQIVTLTAGIVKTELIEEKWDGKAYWLKARITTDSDSMIKSIDSLRKDRVKVKELEELRKKSDELLKENERLRKELITATGEKKQKDSDAYNKTIKDLNALEWLEIGYQIGVAGHWREAIDAFNKSIELNPNISMTYNNRGVAYDNLGNYNQEIADTTKAIELDQKNALAYYNRGRAYHSLGNYSQEIADFNKAIELNPQFAEAYHERGNAYDGLGNYSQAIKDYDKSIEFNPERSQPYYNRGRVYSKLGNTNQAIKDYDKTIELNPQDFMAYHNRGIIFYSLGNKNQAINDYKIAARLGDKEAQEYLIKRGIAW